MKSIPSDSFSENVLISTIPHQRLFTIKMIVGRIPGFVNVKIHKINFFRVFNQENKKRRRFLNVSSVYFA